MLSCSFLSNPLADHTQASFGSEKTLLLLHQLTIQSQATNLTTSGGKNKQTKQTTDTRTVLVDREVEEKIHAEKEG